MTYVIGLTGGIGSGKTVASDHFATLGVPVIDTDLLARQIVEPGQPALEALVSAFGESIILESGQLDRAQLRKLAFKNEQSKTTLDEITHPAIRREVIKSVGSVTAPYCIVVVPLLNSNSPFLDFMKRVLVVTAHAEVKIERVQKRSGLVRKEVQQIMRTQLADDERVLFADDVIANNTTLEHVYREVEKLHQRYLDAAVKNR